jgi:hypothetical protein
MRQEAHKAKPVEIQDWLSLLQIFFCRSKAHSATATKLTLRVQTVAAVSALFHQERKRKISNAAQTNPVSLYLEKCLSKRIKQHQIYHVHKQYADGVPCKQQFLFLRAVGQTDNRNGCH